MAFFIDNMCSLSADFGKKKTNNKTQIKEVPVYAYLFQISSEETPELWTLQRRTCFTIESPKQIKNDYVLWRKSSGSN